MKDFVDHPNALSEHHFIASPDEVVASTASFLSPSHSSAEKNYSSSFLLLDLIKIRVT